MHPAPRLARNRCVLEMSVQGLMNESLGSTKSRRNISLTVSTKLSQLIADMNCASVRSPEVGKGFG